MRVRMFKPEFAALIKSGAKRQTIRPIPNRMPKVGDHESWRKWAYKPYKSPLDGSPAQVELAQVELTMVEPICITGYQVIIEEATGLYSMSGDELASFAQADGFDGSLQFFEWFHAVHGSPFRGILIKAKDLIDPNHCANLLKI